MRFMLTLIAALGTVALSASAQPLQRYAWENRLVVVFADSALDPRLTEQRAILEDQTGLAERDLVVIEVIGDTATAVFGDAATFEAAALRTHYEVAEDGFTTLLIGKDTGVKLRQATPISSGVLYATIDAMPMRRREMGR